MQVEQHAPANLRPNQRSEEHTSELQYRCISYAVFCLKKDKQCQPARLLFHDDGNLDAADQRQCLAGEVPRDRGIRWIVPRALGEDYAAITRIDIEHAAG